MRVSSQKSDLSNERYVRAIENGGPEVGATMLHVSRSAAVARLLLAHNPDAWRRDRTARGDTPLHRACVRDDAEVVGVLLESGARWGRAFLNGNGETAYDLALPAYFGDDDLRHVAEIVAYAYACAAAASEDAGA